VGNHSLGYTQNYRAVVVESKIIEAGPEPAPVPGNETAVYRWQSLFVAQRPKKINWVANNRKLLGKIFGVLNRVENPPALIATQLLYTFKIFTICRVSWWNLWKTTEIKEYRIYAIF